MALGSGIEWTESTWNPVTGCNKISPGCKYCYAERMAERLQAMGQPNYKDGFKLTLQPQMLELPLQPRFRSPDGSDRPGVITGQAHGGFGFPSSMQPGGRVEFPLSPTALLRLVGPSAPHRQPDRSYT